MIVPFYILYYMPMIEKTREQEQQEYKAKYKSNWQKNREKKAKDSEVKTNDQWQTYVEWLWWVTM